MELINFLGCLHYVMIPLNKKLEKNEEFMQGSVWKLYLHVKRISELVCAEKISERQLIELEMEIAK